ncbi:unnamed protein product [Moneuplotes crassus]|uniref:Ribosomal RNA large subunit methyltransferase K/L-like methyltransferase domain-containing protein n=1 Tax=Euplotes crassus TaxID=5936 RepID=A0AAD1XE20_EUPCR|nr:unnamed protein product [Moneuplotes crassus]
MKFLFKFRRPKGYIDFILPEIKSLANLYSMLPNQRVFASMKNISQEREKLRKHRMQKLELESQEVAHKILKRSILIDSMTSIHSEINGTQQIPIVGPEILEQNKSKTFRIDMTLTNRDSSYQGVSHFQKLKLIKQFYRNNDTLGKKFDLDSPEVIYHIHFDYQHNKTYLGQRYESDYYYKKYRLTNRPFRGFTCTKAELAFLMCNLAELPSDTNCVVYDPFVGSASTLLSAAHLGANTIGSDLAYKTMFGKPKLNKDQKNVFTNFDHYGLPRPQLFLSDFSRSRMRREIFDHIICDPPYGIQAASKVFNGSLRIKSSRNNQYSYKDVIDDLLAKSYHWLKPDGTLVFLYYIDKDIPHKFPYDFVTRFPSYPGMILEEFCENPLIKSRVRYAVKFRFLK